MNDATGNSWQQSWRVNCKAVGTTPEIAQGVVRVLMVHNYRASRIKMGE